MSDWAFGFVCGAFFPALLVFVWAFVRGLRNAWMSRLK